MNAFSNNALKAYANVGIDTGVAAASAPRLVLMLYEGAIAAIASAQQQLRQKNIAARGQAISRAIAIINDGLKASLDTRVGGELALNLSELYAYMGRRLVHANLKSDQAALEEVRQLLLQLKGAWETLAATPTAAAPAAAPPPRAAALTYGRS